VDILRVCFSLHGVLFEYVLSSFRLGPYRKSVVSADIIVFSWMHKGCEYIDWIYFYTCAGTKSKQTPLAFETICIASYRCRKVPVSIGAGGRVAQASIAVTIHSAVRGDASSLADLPVVRMAASAVEGASASWLLCGWACTPAVAEIEVCSCSFGPLVA
jgi:hypothetical protein